MRRRRFAVKRLLQKLKDRFTRRKKTPDAPHHVTVVTKSEQRAPSETYRPSGRGSGGPAAKPDAHKPHAHAHAHRPAPAAAAPAAPWDVSQYVVAPAEGKTRFHDLNLPDDVLHAIADLKFQYCTPIQAKLLPEALKGLDAAGQAQTGTGKTAAFLIGMLDRFFRHPLPGARKPGAPRALVLAPTRELVIQIQKDAEALGKYGKVTSRAVYGGMDYRKQQDQLKGPVDIVAATPGRLLDFQRHHVLDLGRVEVLVIDEADRMLDMGFIPDIRRIVYSLPPKDKRQTLLFSATLTPEVMRLASQWMVDPVKIEIEPEHVAVKTVDQQVYVVTTAEKLGLLLHLLKQPGVDRVLVFRNRREGTTNLYRKLGEYGIRCAELSGDVPQEKRLRVLEKFKGGEIKVVVATDVAGRGIHVDGVTHVINYDVPYEAEAYVHRIGRTGRAGASGQAITFACEEESFNLPAIEELLGEPMKYVHPEEEWLKLPEPTHPAREPAPGRVHSHPRRPGRPPRRRRG